MLSFDTQPNAFVLHTCSWPTCPQMPKKLFFAIHPPLPSPLHKRDDRLLQKRHLSLHPPGSSHLGCAVDSRSHRASKVRLWAERRAYLSLLASRSDSRRQRISSSRTVMEVLVCRSAVDECDHPLCVTVHLHVRAHQSVFLVIVWVGLGLIIGGKSYLGP